MTIQSLFENLNQRYSFLQSEQRFYQNSETELTNQIEESTKSLKGLTTQAEIQKEAISGYKDLLDVISKEQIVSICNLVTKALQAIFEDRDYSLDIVFGERGTERVCELVLVENKQTDEGVIELRTSFEDGIGGGVMVVVGFLLQVYFVLYFDLAHVIFCDESFSQLSDVYLPNLLEFIKALCQEKDFSIVLISHDSRIIDSADYVYQVNQGEVTGVR